MSTTASMSLRTSWFQNLRTRNPCPSNQAVRSASDATCPACWPPSSSMIRRFSRHTKSAMYGPSGCCLRNLCSPNCRKRRCLHRARSASVGFFRSALARSLLIPPPSPSPTRGGGRCLRCPPPLERGRELCGSPPRNRRGSSRGPSPWRGTEPGWPARCTFVSTPGNGPPLHRGDAFGAPISYWPAWPLANAEGVR
jgi:hypothetical protein